MRIRLKELILPIALTVAALIVIFWLMPAAYSQSWTGLGSYTTPKSDTEDYHPAKTLWDWGELLIVPLVLAGGAFWFNREEKKRDLANADDNRREAALQTYLDRMSELLLHEGLGDPIPKTEEAPTELPAKQVVARARTLTVLPGLDPRRKGDLLRFLYESKLIGIATTKVSLIGADLRGAHLWGARLNMADLREADLRGAHLIGADLRGAHLRKADLYEADLRGAHLIGAHLREADLRGAHLIGADLREADLYEADLREADLYRADLRGAHPVGANLRRANLREADLPEADLAAANLSEADLRGAHLIGAHLSGAAYSRETKWPDGFDPKAAGAVLVE